jgi:hydrogenase maturation protease
MPGEKSKLNKPKVAVLGLGNDLLRDDGIGIYVVRELAGTVDQGKVDIIDGGSSIDIFFLIEDQIEKLIIIDAMDAGEKPGEVKVINIDDLHRVGSSPVSLHDMDIPANLKILSISNPALKSVVVIGVQAADIGPGLELTPEVAAAVPKVVDIAMKEIEGN